MDRAGERGDLLSELLVLPRQVGVGLEQRLEPPGLGPDEPVGFPVEGFDGGSISMLAVRFG